MLFGKRLLGEVTTRSFRRDRYIFLESMVADFSKAFPCITFKLELEIKLINAQALRTVDRRYVKIYGGLGMHPKLGPDSIIFITLHEVGHHLSNGRCSSYYDILACECASDFWAVNNGADVLRETSGSKLNLLVALDELSNLLNENPPPSPDGDTNLSPSCWSRGWAARKSALMSLMGEQNGSIHTH
jgi:hypothetical protein